MNAFCPDCHQPLTADEVHFNCIGCGVSFAKQAICPECRQPLQVLKACGAVNYFCANGHGLISSKRVEFLPLTESL